MIEKKKFAVVPDYYLYNPIKNPTIDNSGEKGLVFLAVVFLIFTIFSFILILYNSHHSHQKVENINLAVENIDKKIEELNKLKANLKQTNDRK